MAKRFKLADGTVGMLEDDGTFVPEGSASKPADLPESPFGGVVSPGEEGEHGVPVQKAHAYPMRTHTSEELGLDPGMADPTGQRRHISPAEAAREHEVLMAQTPLEAKRAGDPIANDPIAQQIVTSGLGFGAGRLVGPVAGRFIGGGVEGAVGTAAGGGDPTTGFALGALPATASLAKRGFQGAVDRQAERLAVSPTPVKTAAVQAYDKAKEHALALTQAAIASGVLGSHYAGHAALGLAPFVPSVAKVGAVAADEAAANIARKFGMVPRATTAAEAARVGVPTGTNLGGESPAEKAMIAEAGPRPPHEHITVPEAPAVTEKEAARKAAAEALGRRRIESSGFRPAPAETRPLETTGTQSVTTNPIQRALANAGNQREFIQTAVKKGYDARDARALWREAHPYRPSK